MLDRKSESQAPLRNDFLDVVWINAAMASTIETLMMKAIGDDLPDQKKQ